MDFVSDLMGFIDDAITGAAAGTFGAVAGNYGGIITILAVLSFAAYGIAIAIGAATTRPADFFQLVMRIILVFIFGLTWNNFQVIYEALTNTSDGLVTALFSVAGGGAANSVESAENFAANAQSAAASVIQAEGSITRGVLGALMYVLLAALQAAYVLVAGFAKIMIGILVGLAPFAISATIFARTQFLFEAWLSSLIGYFMYPVAAAGVMGFIATVAESAFDDSSSSTLLGITGVVVIILVGIYALKSIPQIASNITGQLNLAGIAPEALRVAARPAVKAGEIAKGAGGQVASGFMTGGETAQRAQHSRRFGSATDMKLANLGAAAGNNAIGRFAQRRKDVQFAREANERVRRRSRSKSTE